MNFIYFHFFIEDWYFDELLSCKLIYGCLYRGMLSQYLISHIKNMCVNNTTYVLLQRYNPDDRCV